VIPVGAKSQEATVIRVQEGESGLRQGNLTEERISILGDYWSKSKEERDRIPLVQLSAISGLSIAQLRHSQRDKRVLDKVKATAEIEATYDAIEARAFLRGVMQAAREGSIPVSEGVKAARTQLELSGDLKKGGPQVQVLNQSVNVAPEYSDEALIEHIEGILGKRVDPDEPEAD